MPTPIIMPKQGQSVESCIISKWYKKKGDDVHKGELLFAYETDKASFEEFSTVDGTILEIFFDEGDDVPVLSNVCVIGNTGESIDDFNPRKKTDKIQTEKTIDKNKDEGLKEEKPFDPILTKKNQDGKVKISPRAKKLSEKTGINYNLADPWVPAGVL